MLGKTENAFCLEVKKSPLVICLNLSLSPQRPEYCLLHLVTRVLLLPLGVRGDSHPSEAISSSSMVPPPQLQTPTIIFPSVKAIRGLLAELSDMSIPLSQPCCVTALLRVPSPLRRAQSGSCWLKQHAAYRQGTAKAPARSCHRPKYSASWFHSTCLETINFSLGNVLSNTSSTRFQALQARNCSLLQHNSGLPRQHSPPAMGLLALKPRQSLPPPEAHPCPHGSVTASGGTWSRSTTGWV